VFKKIIEYFLDTPEKYWVVVFGYHLKKSFLGVILIILGVVFALLPLRAIGLFFILLGIAGHIYKKEKPYFRLWDKYKKSS
jgi:hypothetical protein